MTIKGNSPLLRTAVYIHSTQNQFNKNLCPKFADELDFIKKILLKNGYPDTIIYKCLQFSTKPKLGPERCPLYLRLPWIGNTSNQLKEKIKRSVNRRRFNSVKLRFVLKSNVLFITNLKNCD